MATGRALKYPTAAVCAHCGDEFERTSTNERYCSSACSSAVVEENNRQLRERSGPYYERWRRGIQAATQNL